MAKRMRPIEETLAGELFDHFIDFIEQEGAIPLERAFWGWLIRTNKYTLEALPENTFRYHFGRLISEGYIGVELLTRSLKPLRRVKISTTR